MTHEDFPCFACGSTGPHSRILATRGTGMTDADWERAAQSAPALILCGACQHAIWEPDPGDGMTAPNLTMIRPGLRDLAHQALAARNLPRFLILADGHYRTQLLEDNGRYLRRRGMWEDGLLAQLRLEQTD